MGNKTPTREKKATRQAMQVFRIMAGDEVFKEGDLVVTEECWSCDGDRSSFRNIRAIYLRKLTQ